MHAYKDKHGGALIEEHLRWLYMKVRPMLFLLARNKQKNIFYFLGANCLRKMYFQKGFKLFFSLTFGLIRYSGTVAI